VSSQYPKGTPIKNERQVCIISQEELDQIASAMNLDSIDPARLGATIVIKGIPDFTFVEVTFKAAAKNLRGVCAWVAAEGRVAIGDTLTLHIPDQRAWDPQ